MQLDQVYDQLKLLKSKAKLDTTLDLKLRTYEKKTVDLFIAHA